MTLLIWDLLASKAVDEFRICAALMAFICCMPNQGEGV